ncbi:MAG: hypothetical protein ACXAC7_15575 [Candidatus Hodarchaeales archaeon]|jgi:hypothetical protein
MNSITIAYIQIKHVLYLKKYQLLAILIGFSFFIFYLYTTQLISFTTINFPFAITIVSEWQDKIFRVRAFPNYEPIILFTWGPIFLLIPIPNLFLAVIISVLASLNLTLSVFSITAPTACRINPANGILSALPAFLTGFACCSPVFLIGLGIFSASITLFFIEILPFFIPFSLIGLMLSLFWSSWRLGKKNQNILNINYIVTESIKSNV